jgi:hypothetical protein
MESRKAHWDHIYAKPENEVSWYQENPAVSLELIRAAGTPQAAAIIDVGGGASRLVDALLAEGYSDLTVLDLSAKALAGRRRRGACRSDFRQAGDPGGSLSSSRAGRGRQNRRRRLLKSPRTLFSLNPVLSMISDARMPCTAFSINFLIIGFTVPTGARPRYEAYRGKLPIRAACHSGQPRRFLREACETAAARRPCCTKAMWIM